MKYHKNYYVITTKRRNHHLYIYIFREWFQTRPTRSGVAGLWAPSNIALKFLSTHRYVCLVLTQQDFIIMQNPLMDTKDIGLHARPLCACTHIQKVALMDVSVFVLVVTKQDLKFEQNPFMGCVDMGCAR